MKDKPGLFVFDNGPQISFFYDSGLLSSLDPVRVGLPHQTSMAPILPKRSPLVKPFNAGLTRLRERGVIDSLVRSHVTQLPRMANEETSGKVVLGMRAAAGIFAGYGIALGLAALILALEWIKSRILKSLKERPSKF